MDGNSKITKEERIIHKYIIRGCAKQGIEVQMAVQDGVHMCYYPATQEVLFEHTDTKKLKEQLQSFCDSQESKERFGKYLTAF